VMNRGNVAIICVGSGPTKKGIEYLAGIPLSSGTVEGSGSETRWRADLK